MSWRFDPARALEEINGVAAKAAKVDKVPSSPLSSLATLASLADHRHDPAHQAQAIPPLSPEQCQEVHSWPTPTQRVFVALIDHFENQGYKLPQAEPLAWATVKALMERHGGPVGFKSEINPSCAGSRTLPPEVAPIVDLVKSVFGPGIQVNWEE